LNTIKKIFRTDGFSVGLLFDQAKLFPYNHSLADIIFPINKVQAEMMGYLWDASKDTIKIPDTEEDELICTITGLPFRIGDAESEFLMRNKIAAPMRSPGQRFRDRLSKLSLTSKNETQCHVTGKELTNWQQEKRASLSEKAYKIIDKERQSNGK